MTNHKCDCSEKSFKIDTSYSQKNDFAHFTELK